MSNRVTDNGQFLIKNKKNGHDFDLFRDQKLVKAIFRMLSFQWFQNDLDQKIGHDTLTIIIFIKPLGDAGLRKFPTLKK